MHAPRASHGSAHAATEHARAIRTRSTIATLTTAYTSTNITQARPPPGDQRPHGGDHIDRSSRTSPSARHATAHGATVGSSPIRTRPTTASLTSPCSSSDPRGQRCRDRRGDQLARRMSERDEVGVTASLLRWKGRRAASLLALEAVCLARPTTPATHHRQRRRSCIAVPRGGGQDSATSAASEASAAARGPHGPSAVRRSGAVERWVVATGRLGDGRWREKSVCESALWEGSARAWGGPPLNCRAATTSQNDLSRSHHVACSCPAHLDRGRQPAQVGRLYCTYAPRPPV